MNAGQKTVECTIPILKVANIATSLDFYVNVLGFEKGWFYEKDAFAMAGVSRDHSAIYLCQGEQGSPGTWVWIGVADIQPLYEEFQAKGATFVMRPTNYSWAYEMRIRDPDGHVLRFGSEPLPGEPVHD
jgi:catechol 2,3-dioxygenase-like lactoylglutathione lyase family enzyme